MALWLEICEYSGEYSKGIHVDTDRIILEIIEGEPVGDQATLLRKLAARGIRLTQPTLSRHLRKLSIRKLEGRYQVAEAPMRLRPRCEIVAAPPNLLVLKTDPGHAQMLALHLDKRQPEGVAGTVGGDDTVFIAALPGVDMEELRLRVLAVLGR